MLRPETYLSIAHQANYLASVASGEGEFALANALWGFEAKHKRLAEESRVRQAEDLRAGTLTHVDLALLHALRKRQLISHDEFVGYRRALTGKEVG